MSSEEEDMKASEKRLPLPKPDPANINVLTSHLPKNPILPWNQFDSPWLDDEEGEADTLEEDVEEEDVEEEAVEEEAVEEEAVEEGVDASVQIDKKEDAPDESVITKDVQSNSSSSVKQSNQDSPEEQPQKQGGIENKYSNESVNTDEEDSENT